MTSEKSKIFLKVFISTANVNQTTANVNQTTANVNQLTENVRELTDNIGNLVHITNERPNEIRQQGGEISNRSNTNRRHRQRQRIRITEEPNFENDHHRINFHNNGARNQRERSNNRG